VNIKSRCRLSLPLGAYGSQPPSPPTQNPGYASVLNVTEHLWWMDIGCLPISPNPRVRVSVGVRVCVRVGIGVRVMVGIRVRVTIGIGVGVRVRVMSTS